MSVIMAILDLKKWAEKYQRALQAEPLLTELLQELESLPVNNTIPVRHPQGFVLIDDEWYPVHVLNLVSNGWAEWRLDRENGCESGVAPLLHWADVNADKLPSVNEEMNGGRP